MFFQTDSNMSGIEIALNLVPKLRKEMTSNVAELADWRIGNMDDYRLIHDRWKSH